MAGGLCGSWRNSKSGQKEVWQIFSSLDSYITITVNITEDEEEDEGNDDEEEDEEDEEYKDDEEQADLLLLRLVQKHHCQKVRMKRTKKKMDKMKKG